MLSWAVLLGILMILTSLRASAQGPIKTDNKRYLTLMILNLSDDDNFELDVIRHAAGAGMNSVELTIWWDKVYRNSPNDPGNWSRFDNQIKLATQLKMKVGIRIFLGRNSGFIKGFWTDAESARDYNQNPLREIYNYTHFSLLHEPTVVKAQDFVKQVTERYRYLHDENNLLFLSVTTTPTQEAGYHHTTIPPNKEYKDLYLTLFDYSSFYKNGFIEWLKGKYKKIIRLNLLWGSEYKSFEEVLPPATPWDPKGAFYGRRGKDWYIYRHLVLKQFNDRMIQTVKAVDKSIPYVLEFGAVVDNESGIRGTLAFHDLSTLADGVKIHDIETYDHRWTMDVLRSNIRADQMVMNEVFYNHLLPDVEFFELIDESFESGAKLITLVLSTKENVDAMRNVTENSARKWLNSPMKPVVPRDTMAYQLSKLVDQTAYSIGAFQAWKNIARGGSTPKPVYARLDEDILKDEYWIPASNHLPRIQNPIPMQIIPINRDFTFRIPTDTFSDEDGTITKVEVLGQLPSWLTFVDGQFKGLPTSLGDTRLLVKGTDDEGGTTEAYLTIRVDTRENANKPPTVKKNLANVTTAVNQPFTFTLPADLFVDSDGSISRVEASELPNWLTFSNGVLKGLPSKTGNSRVSLKAYDDLNAFVEIYFSVQVVEPQFLNSPPFVQGTLPVRFAKVREPFRYTLPNNLFGDVDGYITVVSVQNLPTWLNFSLNEFSGTPPEEGEFRVTIRAYDNSGGFVETPLIIRAEVPKLTFDLLGSGRLVDRKLLRTLKDGDEVPVGSLPDLLNVYAFGNFDFDQIDFTLTGPYRYSATAWKFPYAVFQDESGFAPYVGTYTLYASAFKGVDHVLTNSIKFTITAGDSLQPNLLLDDWQAYPNPFDAVFNIKLPENQSQSTYAFSLVAANGQQVPIPARWIAVHNNIAQIDLVGMSVSPGMYFIRVESNGELVRLFKVVKR